MEGVADRLGKMKLTEAERKKIDLGAVKTPETLVPQALCKLLSEKAAHPDAIERALGRVWCPLKGIECQSLGDNKFLVTFLQASGKIKALEERPWVFSNELLVMVDLDDSKAIDEIEFHFIPIWIRVSKLPIGMMTSDIGEAIGNEVGSFLETDVEDGKVKVGSFLRIKVKLDIRKPLMRGVTVTVGREGVEKWCPLSYEYLPDFCYVCGLIGHTDRSCSIKLKKGEERRFGGFLRWLPPKFQGEQDGRGRWEPRGSLSGRSLSSGERGSGRSSKWGSGGSSRSDSLSWRKNSVEEGVEVTSPSKVAQKKSSGGNDKSPKRALFVEQKTQEAVGEEQVEVQPGGKDVVLDAHLNSAMQTVGEGVVGGFARGEEVNAGKKKEKGSQGKVRAVQRRPRSSGAADGSVLEGVVGNKRTINDVEMEDAGDDLGVKKSRRGEGGVVVDDESNLLNAGLSEQPCKDQ